MNLSTKYEFGQTLFVIAKHEVSRPDKACPACEDGQVLLGGERFQCPKCNGTRVVKVRASGWVISGSGVVGNIKAELGRTSWPERWGDGYVEDGKTFLFVSYMLDSTGIGSGTVHQEPNLWPSREEAQAECDRRNAVKP